MKCFTVLWAAAVSKQWPPLKVADYPVAGAAAAVAAANGHEAGPIKPAPRSNPFSDCVLCMLNRIVLTVLPHIFQFSYKFIVASHTHTQSYLSSCMYTANSISATAGNKIPTINIILACVCVWLLGSYGPSSSGSKPSTSTSLTLSRRTELSTKGCPACPNVTGISRTHKTRQKSPGTLKYDIIQIEVNDN